MTKAEIRQKVRARLFLAGAARFPAIDGYTPNFAGADRAARLVRDLPMWRRARTLKLDADAPLLPLRRAALLEGKIVYVAIPRLRGDRCFVELDATRLGARLPRALSLRGALRYGRLVAPHEMRPIDVIVCGSLAVTRQGARVGRGGGMADLEYGLLRMEGKVREYTPVLTLVHPAQIVDDRLPMRGHDIPVDFVVTPDQVIAAPSLHPRPRGIIWELLREDLVQSIPALRRGRRNLLGAQQTPRNR